MAVFLSFGFAIPFVAVKFQQCVVPPRGTYIPDILLSARRRLLENSFMPLDLEL
jgi:hypothetical protein